MRCCALIAACIFTVHAAASAEANLPSLAVRIDGLVQHAQTFTLAQLKALPAANVQAEFTTMHGQDKHGWTGALLWTLATNAGLRDEPGHKTTMRHVLMVKGTDGYQAAIALGEIDPMIEGKQVLVAYRQDGAAGDLASLRLIVPHDKHGARSVHDVAEIEVR